MSEDVATPIVSDDEIEAALAEAEASDSIPSLDQELDDDNNVVAVPVDAGLAPLETQASKPSRPARPEPAAHRPPEPSAAPADPAPGPDAGPPQRIKITPAKILDWAYVALDQSLTVINAPFTWLGAETRQLVGLVAGAVIATSIICALVLPAVVPARNAVTVLHDKSEEAIALENAPPADSEAAAENQ